MKLLLDTHLLVWAAAVPRKLSPVAIKLIEDQANVPTFSVASIWEIAIKRGLAQLDPRLEPGKLRRMLLENGYEEILISAPHAISAGALPDLHNDPFDRLLVAQAAIEGALLLTADRKVARYPGSIRLV